MAIANKNDLTHVVRTTQQWESSYDKYECIPEGVLCIEFTASGQALAKIGNGRDIFSKLPYIGGADLTNYFTKEQTTECINDILKAKRYICIKGILNNKNQLPTNATCGDLYFVISQNQSSSNKYDEYVYSPSNTWETLGSIPIDIDLSEYAKIVYVDEKIDEVNERIDDIEQHGTHTHANKDILDLITAAFTAEEKDKLSTLYNYDDTELRELITQASHTHSNKDILDAISAPFTKEDKSKLDQLNPYDDSILKEKIQALERLAHEHSNKRILDRTTASFTTEYERKMRWIRLYTGCTGMEEGIAGLVPAAQAGEEDYVLSGSGEWVPQTSGGGTYELPIATTTTLGGIKVGDGLEIDANGVLSAIGGGGGGDSIAEGDGITITTDPQTGIKTISVNTGDHLEIDENTGELNVTDVDYEAGQGIHIGSDYTLIEYIKNSGNYDQIIITDIIPNFSDKIEIDMKIGAAVAATVWDEPIFGCSGSTPSSYRYNVNVYLASNDSNISCYNHFTYVSGNTGSNFFLRPSGVSYDGTNAQRQTLIMAGSTATLGNVSKNFSNEVNNSFIDPQIGIAIFGNITDGGTKNYFNQCNLTVYGVKLYDSNNTLLHDLRPAERGIDGEAGLYDLITHKFYGNAGNGSFVKGPPVSSVDDRLISAKIGNGLQFDSNDAIEVVTGNGLQINQDGELEIDPSIIPDVPEYSSGEAITIRDVSQILPAGYVEVDYIEGVGNYTVIDYIPNRKTKIVGTASQTQTSYDPVLFGNRTGNSGQQFVFWFNRYDSTQAKVGFVYGTNTWGTSSDCDNGKLISYTLGDQFTFLISLDDEFNINDSFVHNITENGAPASNLKLGIFALVNTPSDEIESSDQIFRGRMYEFKIYEDDDLVVNLIPAISASTNQGGFYDVINDIFYTSKTATPFGYDPSTIHSTGKVIDVNYGNGLTVNQNNELEINTGDGLSVNANNEVEISKATANTIGGIKVGDGLSIESDGTLSVVGGSGGGNYSAGDAIEFETVTDTHDIVWNMLQMSHTWVNKAYTAHVGGAFANDSLCVHSDITPLSNLFSIPQNGTIYTIEARDQNDNLLHCIIDYHDGNGNHLNWNGEFISDPTKQYTSLSSAIYISVGVVNTDHSTPLAISNVKSVTLTWKNVTEASTEINVKYGNGLTLNASNELEVDLPVASDSTLGGVIVGDGILVDSDGTISVDPTIIPEVTEYEAGTAISIEDVEHGGVTFDAWDSGTGWSNWAYTTSTGDGGMSWNPEVHSSVADSWKIPEGAIQVRVKALSTSDVLLYPTMHWLTSKGTGRFGYSGPTGGMPYDDWIDVNSNAVYMNLGIRRSEGSNIALSPSEIKSVELTFQTISEIEVDVWNGGTGWLNGDYTSGNSDSFATSWYYTYHYNYQQYIEVPAGATHVMVRGISNENDSHFEGGGINAFDSNHHHVHWWGCAWEWHEISSDTVYVQPNVKWNNDNTRTISGSDVKSVTLVWKLPALEINQAINVKYGNGLTVNQNNELEVNIGTGLEFDQVTGAINVTGSGEDTIAEGDGISITDDQQTGDKIISVNYGDGLTIDPVTGALMFDGQLPEGTIIKKLTYMGDGGATNNIQFEKKPIAILNIYGAGQGTKVSSCAAPIDAPVLNVSYGTGNGSNTAGMVSCTMSYNDTTNVLSLTGGNDPGVRCNMSGETYTVYYLIKGHAGSGTSETNEVSVIKTISYTGTGTNPNIIQFPETPNLIISLNGRDGGSGDMSLAPFDPIHSSSASQYVYFYTNNATPQGQLGGAGHGTYSFDTTTNILTLTGGDPGAAFNVPNQVYYLKYSINETIAGGGGGSDSYEPGTAIVFSNQERKMNPNMTSDVLPYGEVIESGHYSTRYGWNAFDGVDSQTWQSHCWGDNTNALDNDPDSCYVGYVFPEDVYLDKFILSTTSDREYTAVIQTRSEGIWTTVCNVTVPNIGYDRDTYTLQSPVLCDAFRFAVLSSTVQYWTTSSYGGNVCNFEAYGYSESSDQISVKYGDGLTVNNSNELEVNLGSGLSFDANGAIQVTGSGSGDTVAEGAGIEITTDQQTGDKVIAINPGAGLQVNQTTNELEVSSGVVTSIAPTQNTPGSITVTEGDGTATPVSVISQMGGATSSAAGTAGYVPAPASGDDDAYLRGDGTWDDSVVTEDDELTLVFVPDDYQPS